MLFHLYYLTKTLYYTKLQPMSKNYLLNTSNRHCYVYTTEELSELGFIGFMGFVGEMHAQALRIKVRYGL